MHPVLIVFVVLLAAKTALELWLDHLNRRHVEKSAGPVPEAFRGFMDQEKYDKSIEYTLAKHRLGLITTVFDAVLLAALVLTPALAWIYGGLTELLGRPPEGEPAVWRQALALIGTSIIIGLPGLPFEWYAQFRLEERFGFNKSTLGLWITDKVKGFGVGLVIGVPLLCLLLWLVSLPLWWVWAFVVVFVFQLAMIVIFPKWIMPLFNKFEPMEEGRLRDRLMGLAGRTGFSAQTILVMDGSKRSGHSNAFFTGFGKFRRIVLFDTLVEQLDEAELEAVLAHEIGHYKLGHIPRMLGMSAGFMLAAFAALGWLIASPWFLEGFGFAATPDRAAAFLLFGLVSGLASFWFSPLTNILSRKHEYEADAFARDAVKAPEPLIQALRKLSEKNLSNLTPHPAYSGFHYSHPTLIEREKALLT